MDLGLKNEDGIQAAIVQWARKEELKQPALRLLYHIANGGSRHKQEAMKLKAMGVRAGVCDLSLPIARGGYFGLWLEVKNGDKGRIAPEQAQWMDYLTKENHCVGVIRTAEEGIQAITWYLNQPKTRIL